MSESSGASGDGKSFFHSKWYAVLLWSFGLGLAAFTALMHYGRDGGPLDTKKPEPVAVAAVSDQDADRQVLACPCSAGLYCQGPKGGVFCVTDAGKKRYVPR